jgi:hypothetical protein
MLRSCGPECKIPLPGHRVSLWRVLCPLAVVHLLDYVCPMLCASFNSVHSRLHSRIAPIQFLAGHSGAGVTDSTARSPCVTMARALTPGSCTSIGLCVPHAVRII